MLDLDLRGIPGAMVATTAFREAAAAQARSLGFEPAVVWIPHPVQDRTITVREAARLQTFPDRFRFAGERVQTGKPFGSPDTAHDGKSLSSGYRNWKKKWKLRFSAIRLTVIDNGFIGASVL